MLQIGYTKEINNARIHRYNGSIKVWNLDNAGKRGKMVEMISAQSYNESDLLTLASSLDKVESYEQAKALIEAEVDNINNVYYHEEKGVRIPPAGFKTIEISNDHLSIRADYNGFMIADKRDQNNCPRAIAPCWGKKLTHIKKF